MNFDIEANMCFNLENEDTFDTTSSSFKVSETVNDNVLRTSGNFSAFMGLGSYQGTSLFLKHSEPFHPKSCDSSSAGNNPRDVQSAGFSFPIHVIPIFRW